MDSSAAPALRPSAERAAGPAWLAVAMVPITGARTNTLDRHAVGVVGYLQGTRSRYLTPDAILRRWPWPTKPSRKGLAACLDRLAARDVLVRKGGGYRVDRDLQRAASNRGCRFRYELADFASALSPAAVELLALIRGRALGRRRPWADANDFLAELLGANERTVRRALDELQAAGRVETVAWHRLRTGHKIPVLVVRETPVLPATCSENARPVAGNARPVAGNACPPISTRSQDLTAFGSSARPRPLALLSCTPEAEPAAPDQSRGCAADDPVEIILHRRPGPPPAAQAMPSWLRIEALEQRAAGAATTWPTFWGALRAATARLHLAPCRVDDLHEALLAAGLFLPAARMTAAGRSGLRRKRMALAESLAVQRVEPSMVLEAAFVIARMVERDSSRPSQVGPAVATVLQRKSQEFINRSNARVADGRTALPMAAGACAIDRLVQPQKRQPGEFAYPVSWWTDAVPESVHERIRSLRELLATAAGVWEVREIGGEVAAQRLRQQAAERRRANHDRAVDADIRRVRGRLVGAALAGDWRRLARWMPPGTTAADVARLAAAAGVTVATTAIEVGLRSVTGSATA